MTAAAIGLLALAACATPPQSAAPVEAPTLDAPLSRYVDDARSFSVMFPGTPKQTKQVKEGLPDSRRYEGSVGGRAYLVDVADLHRVNGASDEATLQAARDSFVKDATRILLDERLLVSGRPARDIRTEKNGDVNYVRLIIDGKTLYQAISVGRQPSEAAAYFAKSLTPLP